MDKKEIVKILKSYEQKDYKTGGSTIPPSMYSAIAEQLQSTQSDKKEKLSDFCKRANERCTDGNEFAPSFIKEVERLENKLQLT